MSDLDTSPPKEQIGAFERTEAELLEDDATGTHKKSRAMVYRRTVNFGKLHLQNLITKAEFEAGTMIHDLWESAGRSSITAAYEESNNQPFNPYGPGSVPLKQIDAIKAFNDAWLFLPAVGNMRAAVEQCVFFDKPPGEFGAVVLGKGKSTAAAAGLAVLKESLTVLAHGMNILGEGPGGIVANGYSHGQR